MYGAAGRQKRKTCGMAPRKSRKRHRKGGRDRLPWIAAAASLVLLVATYLYTDGGDDFGASTDGRGVSHGRRKERCRASCEDVILTAASDGALPPRHSSPAALASSAVDALFLMHDSDENASTTSRDQRHSEERRYEDQSPASKHDHHRNDGAALPGDLIPLPSGRLPPLIETLVGAVDGRYRHGGRGDGQASTSTIRVDEGYKYHHALTAAGATGGGDDNSVAMAAAAAAAAFWSSRTARGKTGRHRMKVYNDEWDAALRWIAGWGQEQLAGNAQATTGTKAGAMAAGRARDQKRQGAKRGQIRKRPDDGAPSPATDDWGLDGMTAEEEADVSLLIDVCVDECLGMTGNGGFDSRKTSSLGASHERRRRVGFGGDTILTLISSLTGKMTSDRLIPAHQQYRTVLFGMVRLAFTSIVLLGLRSALRWFSTSPLWPSSNRAADHNRWLEEEDMHDICSKSTKKKSSGGKKGRRRKQRSNQTANVERCAVRDNAERPPASESICAKEPEIDSVSPTTSKDDHGGKWIHPDSSRSTSRRQVEDKPEVLVSKSALIATSDEAKWTTASSKSTVKSSSWQSTSGGGKGRSSKRRDRTVGANQKSAVGIQTNETTQMGHMGQKASQQHLEALTRERTEVKGEILVTYPPPANDQNASNSIQSPLLGGLKKNSYAVPTDEQRERAARQLREYQRIQIQKLKDRRKKGAVKQSVGETPCLGERTETAKASYSKTTTFSQAVRSSAVISPPPGIGPPPGLDPMHKTKVMEKTNTVASVDVVSDSVADNLLLSNMLEEDDEGGGPTIASASPSPTRALAFTEGFSKFTVPSSSSGTNPWGEFPLKVSLGAATGQQVTSELFHGAIASMSSTLSNASEGGGKVEHAVASSTWSSSEGGGSESSSINDGRLW